MITIITNENMKLFKKIRIRCASNLLLVGLGLVAVFHALILIGIVPPEIAWGGRAESLPVDLRIAEAFALLVLALFGLIVAGKAGYTRSERWAKISSVGIWIIFLFFVLNTVGNAVSLSPLERTVFAPVTFIFSLLSLRLALSKTVD